MVEREYIDEELAMARQALSDAEQLAAGDGSSEGVVNKPHACGAIGVSIDSIATIAIVRQLPDRALRI